MTEELIPFALCSKQLACEDKEVLARRMFQLYRKNQHTALASQKPVLPHITETTRISDLAGRRSVLLLQLFRFTIDDVQFLRRAQSQWCKSDSYQRLERLVFNIKVTNDTAERGIKTLEDYNGVQTTDNEQRNMILHCVESIRQKYQDFRKKTLSC